MPPSPPLALAHHGLASEARSTDGDLDNSDLRFVGQILRTWSIGGIGQELGLTVRSWRLGGCVVLVLERVRGPRCVGFPRSIGAVAPISTRWGE